MGGWFSVEGSCPVDKEAVYNVYNQRIECQREKMNELNNMPLQANQHPYPGQISPLSTHREMSSIPKGGTDGNSWEYPSPQMFYNALKRKGKGDDVSEDDMDSVVVTHNNLNEDSWRSVLQWELSLHKHESSQPQLLRFTGRPDQISPLARFRSLITGELPFDRHDWYVIRNGKEVRYVIDYYFNEERQGERDAFEIVARPALDSMESALDRVKMSIYQFCAYYDIPCPITGHAHNQNEQIQQVN